MPCLHLEGVPDDLHEALQQVARRQHESVSQIAIAVLRRAMLGPKARQGVLFPLSSMTPRSQRLRDGLKSEPNATPSAPPARSRAARAARAAESPLAPAAEAAGSTEAPNPGSESAGAKGTA